MAMEPFHFKSGSFPLLDHNICIQSVRGRENTEEIPENPSFAWGMADTQRVPVTLPFPEAPGLGLCHRGRAPGKQDPIQVRNDNILDSGLFRICDEVRQG